MTKQRKRPGKSQRAQTMAKAVRIVTAAKVTANQAVLDAEQSKPRDYASLMASKVGPGSKRHLDRVSGGCSRERLKGGSYGVGFRGPRGFNSPKDHLSRAERTPGLLSPRQALAITGAQSQRFARDGFDDGNQAAQNAFTKRQRQKHWKKLGPV